MKTSPKATLLPAVRDDNVMISHSEIKDSFEMANYFPLHLALHIKLKKTPAEHLEEQVSDSHLPVSVLAELGTLLITHDQWVAFLI